jgi:hypothetical protein
MDRRAAVPGDSGNYFPWTGINGRRGGKIAMRIPALAILTIAAMSAATPAIAQTYDPKYPVCLQIYRRSADYYFECAYTSLAQCNMSASGRAAQCIVNPYYAGSKPSPGRKVRRHRRVY